MNDKLKKAIHDAKISNDVLKGTTVFHLEVFTREIYANASSWDILGSIHRTPISKLPHILRGMADMLEALMDEIELEEGDDNGLGPR